MTKAIFLLPFLFLSGVLHAQDKHKVFEKVEIDAHTNPKQWAEHIHRQSQLADSRMKKIPAGTYIVKVQFVVDIHGNLGQIKALNDPGYGLAEKAINMISGYKGKWQPANQCGRNVKAYQNEMITFTISAQ